MFARKRQVDPSAQLDETPQPAPTAISGPAAKLMQMFGLSPDMLETTAKEVGAMLQDFRERLDRIEAKVDHLNEIVDRGWSQYAPPPAPSIDKEKRNGTG